MILTPTETIQVAFADTIGPFSSVIKAVTWDWCSHTALIIDEDEIVEATLKLGVHRSSLKSLKDRSKRWAIVDWPVYSREACIEAALSQEGKKYDMAGVFGVGVHRDWQDPLKWWCSEHTAYSLEQGGPKLYRDRYKHRVTPPDLWKFPHPIVDSFGLAL